MDDSSGYYLTRLLLQRGLGLVYLIAFLVVVNQFRPLCGEHGLLPAPEYMREVPFRDSPSIFYLFPRDTFFTLFGWAGVALSLLAVTGFSERYGSILSMSVWFLLWLIYLSFVTVGQTFYGFGWESILLESGFLAIFLGDARTEPQEIVIWLFRWVLFRIMFGAGLIKLRGDPCWRDYSCLFYHFETQPMPNPLSWYFHWLPRPLLRGGVLYNHFAEVVAPFFYVAPQPLAAAAGISVLIFQGILIVSGNFSWLSFLTLVIAFSTFDDGFLGKVIHLVPPELASPQVWQVGGVWALLLLVAFLSVKPVMNLFSGEQLMNANFDSLHLVNTYGAFGSITRERYEIVIEGTDDTVTTPHTRWKEYGFKGKPGDPAATPAQIAPYHLRLDWLMWFAAMPSPYLDRWFIRLLQRLLEGDEATLSLLKENPFPHAPPRQIRALHYRYRFSTPQEKRRTGLLWQRQLARIYFPAVSLTDPTFRSIMEEVE
ncbi:lipase maturation factor family protein [Geomonas sp. RF6]|uniref:lipase maturation factor family protein n=1 Tax=Geomonas sp. RF6 TaxID=2897342 RepID=UPI001E6162CD|nr:lipase maturation factor family protein [Geomonas sp. RF6]UFS69596.1 lipase maturation factor family protein [Geomonas sp. RF6]